jgi:membrane-associated phospholipid phosphatase
MQPSLAAMAPSIAARDVSSASLLATVRRSEWVVVAFLFYAVALAEVLPLRSAVQSRVLVWNCAIVLAYSILVGVDFAKPSLPASITRDWLPLAIVLFAYREMGWFAQPHLRTVLESRWVVWDRLVLHAGSEAVIEALGPVVSSVLEIAYSLVYALAPISVALLYLTGRRHRVDRLLSVFALGVLLCYAQFPFWPSEPPLVVLFGQDVPSYNTIFRRFNLWMLGNCGIHTSVFPSAHVAGAFSAFFGMRSAAPTAKRATRFLFVMAVLIAVATVYGRYHYLADATAGLLIAVLVSELGIRLRPHSSQGT